MLGTPIFNRYSKDSKHNKGKFRKLPRQCAKCGSTKNLQIHHKSGNRDNKSRSDLVVLCVSCHRQLHDSGKFKKSKSKGSMVTLYTPAILINEPTHPEALQLAMAKDFKNSDLMYTSFILVHAGRNGNRDTFYNNELEESYATPRNKPINVEHSKLNIGVIYDSMYIKSSELSEAHRQQYGLGSDATDFIQCEGVIWKYKFPKESKEIQQRFQDKQLFFSMEVWFQKAQCSVCGEEFYREMDYCDHLVERYSNKIPAIERQLHGYNFGGAAIAKNPADKGAVGLALASKVLKIENMELLEEVSKAYGYKLEDYINSLFIEEV